MASLNQRFIGHQVVRQNALLRHLVLLCLLCAGLSTAVVYPVRLPSILLAQFDAAANAHRDTWGNVYLGQLRSILAFNHAPLVLKETVSSAFLTIALCFSFLYTVRTISLHCVLNHNSVPDEGRPDGPALRGLRNPFFWAGLFLVYCGFSAVFWTPTPHHSLRTLLLCALGIGAAWMLYVLQPRWGDIQKFMVSVALAGTLIAFVSFLQHIEAAWWFLPRFDDPRNRVGSLIGHNTGLSAYLLFPLSFAISLWFVANRIRTRLLIGLALILMLFVLVAAQSRAIWPIGSVMLVVQCAILARGTGYRVRLRTLLLWIVALLIVLVLVQSMAPTVNPLARHSVRISERLRRDFSPGQLLKETRLRIFVVSLPLIAKSPLLGHGIGAFQYVYPPAHGEYFVRHPDSVLGTTVRRTDVAHNDYLQLLVETGLLGSILFFTALGLVARRVREGYLACSWGREKVLLTGLVAPTCAIAVHAFFDFPFHVHPIALTAVFSLALAYTAADQTLRARGMAAEPPVSRVCSEQPQNSTERPNKDDANGRPSSPQPHKVIRPALVLSLVAVFAAWLVSPLAFELILRSFISDSLQRDAANWSATAQALSSHGGGAKYQALDNAKELYRRAIKANVFNGLAMEGLASAYLLSGTFDFALWQDLRNDPTQRKSAEAIRMNAKRALLAAADYAKLAMERGELRYHYVYYVVGQAYHLLAKLYPENGEYLEASRRAFEQAIALNNADVASLQELAIVYEEQQPPNPERARALRRRIFEVDPDFGARRFLLPVEEAAKRGRFPEAWRSLNKISEAVGDHWSVEFTKARLYLKEALWPPPALDVATTSPEARRWFTVRYNLAKALVNDLSEKMTQNPLFERFRLDLFAAGDETTSALKLADRLLLASEVRDPELDVLRHELGIRANSPRPLRWVEKDSTEFWYYRQRLRTLLLGPVSLGSAQLANLARTDPNLVLKLDEGLRAAAYLRAAHQDDLVLVIAKNLAKSFPSDPDVKNLLESIRGKSH